MHILQITICFKRRAAYTKGCYSQSMVRCLGRTSHYDIMHSEKNMCNCEGPILQAYIYHVLHLRKHIVKRALHVQEGSVLI